MSPELLEKDIELAALDIFSSMGCTWMDCFEESFGDNTPLGRLSHPE